MPTEVTDSPFWPFANDERNGPGPKGQTNVRADRWRCRCKQVHRDLSICRCEGIRRLKNGKLSRAKKTVRINLQRKREYQKKHYRPFLKRTGKKRS